MKKTFIVGTHPMSRTLAVQAVSAAPDGFQITIAEPTRSGEQNARLWASLSEVSRQVDWYGRKLSPEDWKNVFSASLRKLDVVPNLDGTGFVALGQSTSKLSKREFSDLLEIIYAFGAERGVVFNDELEPA